MTPEQIQELRELADRLRIDPHVEGECADALRACAEREERALAGITDAVVSDACRVFATNIDHTQLLESALRKVLQSAALALRPDAKLVGEAVPSKLDGFTQAIFNDSVVPDGKKLYILQCDSPADLSRATGDEK